MKMNDRAGFLFVFVVMLVFGLYGVINPKAVKKANADVPGFPKSGVLVDAGMGLEIVRNRTTRGIWTLPIFVFNALRSSTLFLSKSTCPNLIAFTIIGQINQKVPDDQHVDFFFWGTEIKKKHRALYPDSKLVLAMNICGSLMVVTFLVLSWFVFHSK
jgi:hypothetical protein